MDEKPLNPNQTLFVEYLLAEEKLDGTAAYEKVYRCSHKAASVGASKLLADPRIKRLVDARMKERAEQAGLTAAELLLELRRVATADPRELSEHYRGACRFCHGIGHLYHRTPNEYRTDLAAYMKLQEALPAEKRDTLGLRFDAQGGVGFNPTRAAHPDCPECFGHGAGYSYFKDTRKLSPAAARIFSGVKETKDGLELKTRSQDKAMELYMRHMGMLSDQVKDPGGTAEEKAAKVRELLTALDAKTGDNGRS